MKDAHNHVACEGETERHTMLEVSEARLSFDKMVLCHQLSFEIAASQIGLLMAPSGAGKSTLLKWIAGIEVPGLSASGTILLSGQPLAQMRAEDRKIGFLFQQPLLFPHLNVAQNISFGLSPQITGSARQNKISAMLEQADLAGFERRDPKTLSGGQQSRIALLRAILANPKALLLDEPFSSLDDAHRSDILALLVGFITALNIPVILVSHDPRDETLDQLISLTRINL